MPRVSFILPAYKRRFLREAIASILAQTYRDFELVVVDDRSPENLKEVVDEFHDDRLTYHRNEVNIGGKDLVAAWNRAMEYARGEWCVLASDDDAYDPDYLSEMIRLIGKYPEVDLVHCRIRCMDADGECTQVSEERLELATQAQLLRTITYARCLQAAPEFMFRCEAWKAAGCFVDFPLAWGADDATWIKLARNGVACSPKILFSFRHSGANITTRNDFAVPKFEARAAYLKWLCAYVPTMRPHGAEDECILNEALQKSCKGINREMFDCLSEMPLGAWLRCSYRNRVPLRMFLLSACKRCRCVRAIRQWLLV